MTPIGVDLGGRTIKAAQLARTRDGYKLHAAAIVPLERPNKTLDEKSAAALRQTLEASGFEGRRIVLTAQGGEQVEAFQKAGFNVTAVDQQVAAINRACLTVMGNSPQDERPTAAIADFGWTGGNFLVAHGTEIRFQQRLESAGMAPAHAAIVDRFGLGDDISEGLLGEVYADFTHSTAAPESVHAAWTRALLMRRVSELATELTDLIAHARQRYPIRLSKLLLTGGGAQSKGLENFLAARLGLEVVTCRPTLLMNCNGTQQALAQSPALVQAMGLARWEA